MRSLTNRSFTAPVFFIRGYMLKLYEINPSYIDYLSQFSTHLFHNKKEHQTNPRKYIGVVLTVNKSDYFVPLSSFKEKHKKMQESVDFLKIGTLAVLNINNMLPVPQSECIAVDISSIKDEKYKHLLLQEYRIIKLLEDKILKNAKIVYSHKIHNENKTSLAKRCNDFLLLEQKMACFNS